MTTESTQDPHATTSRDPVKPEDEAYQKPSTPVKKEPTPEHPSPVNSPEQTVTSFWQWVPAAFALAGIIVFIFATYGPPASSSGFVSTIKGALQTAAPEYVEGKTHYQMIKGPGSWLFAFVLGMALGGFVAGLFAKVPVVDVPQIWRRKFGGSKVKRCTVTFIGGFLILFASRLAGGCTLGLFISGSTQLAISGLYFGGVIFAVAMLTARVVYRRPDKEGES